MDTETHSRDRWLEALLAVQQNCLDRLGEVIEEDYTVSIPYNDFKNEYEEYVEIGGALVAGQYYGKPMDAELLELLKVGGRQCLTS